MHMKRVIPRLDGRVAAAAPPGASPAAGGPAAGGPAAG